MNINSKNLLVGLALVVSLGMTFTHTVHAQATSFSVESIGSQIGLGNADLKQTVINLINLALGLMSLIAVVMIIIGGFTWLTAGGNEEKVDKAKKIISAAVIGMIIVIIAWAIVIFVARTTANVTTTA
jgi:cytochrome bd-type quinol oxidase subunit 2